jgi:hypothetical protein
VDPLTRCLQRPVAGAGEADYRLQLARRYTYVLPEAHLVDIVARRSPLVEVGAGTGYWAYLLRARGADVVAYDQAPPGGERANRYHLELWPWTEVVEGDASALRRHADRSLFVCWPPLFSSLGEVLRSYAGGCVIYVGDDGSRTARLSGLEDAFDELERWPVTAMDPDPVAPAQLSVWRRKAAPAAPAPLVRQARSTT